MNGFTAAEDRAAQRRALAVLADLLAEDLPPLQWTIQPAGHLVGLVVGNPTGRRQAFEAWADRLDATRWPQRRQAGCYTVLRAAVDRHRGVRISIAADVLDETDGGTRD